MIGQSSLEFTLLLSLPSNMLFALPSPRSFPAPDRCGVEAHSSLIFLHCVPGLTHSLSIARREGGVVFPCTVLICLSSLVASGSLFLLSVEPGRRDQGPGGNLLPTGVARVLSPHPRLGWGRCSSKAPDPRLTHCDPYQCATAGVSLQPTLQPTISF